jgi:hypothetical protein
MPDPRDYNHGEILSFVMKDSEAENPERLTGFFRRTAHGNVGIRTADDTWIQFDQVTDIRRVPVIKNVPLFMVQVSQEIGELSRVGLGDEDRHVIGLALTKVIDDLYRIPPEPPQWTTVKVTYSDPIDRAGWDYYTRDVDLLGLSPSQGERWMGPKERVTWAALQKMGRVEILPTPKHEED